MFENSFNVSTGTKVSEKILSVLGARFATAEVTIETDALGNGVARIPFASGVAIEYGVALAGSPYVPTTPFNLTISTEKFGQTANIVAAVAVSANTITSLGPASTTHEISAVTAVIPNHVCGPVTFSISGAGANKRVTVGLMLGRMR